MWKLLAAPRSNIRSAICIINCDAHAAAFLFFSFPSLFLYFISFIFTNPACFCYCWLASSCWNYKSRSVTKPISIFRGAFSWNAIWLSREQVRQWSAGHGRTSNVPRPRCASLDVHFFPPLQSRRSLTETDANGLKAWRWNGELILVNEPVRLVDFGPVFFSSQS